MKEDKWSAFDKNSVIFYNALSSVTRNDYVRKITIQDVVLDNFITGGAFHGENFMDNIRMFNMVE